MKQFFLLVVALLFSLVTCGPCDIYASGGTPCVCAHSTTRALYDTYKGSLYQVQRDSDKALMSIGVTSNGAANSTVQDTFCKGAVCHITIIYDQSGMNNHLTVGTPGVYVYFCMGVCVFKYIQGGANPKGNTPAVATAEEVTVHGRKVYSVYINAGQGYFHDGSKSGTPRTAHARTPHA